MILKENGIVSFIAHHSLGIGLSADMVCGSAVSALGVDAWNPQGSVSMNAIESGPTSLPQAERGSLLKTRRVPFRQRMRDWGLRRTLYWYLMHALSKFGIHLHYVRVGADMLDILGNEVAPETPQGYGTRVVGVDELLPLAGVVAGLDREFVLAAFERGDVCTANYFDGELVGFSFSTCKRARVSAQLDVLVPDGFRYGYKAWTHPEHRRRNLARARGYVRRQTLKWAHEVRSISYIETHNYPSLLRSYRHPRQRSLPMGFCGWVTLFGREIPFNSRRAKWIGFEFVRRDDHGRRQYVG